MSMFIEPGRRGRTAGFILSLGGCLLAAVLLVPGSAPGAGPADEPPPALSEVHDSGPRGGAAHPPRMTDTESVRSEQGPSRTCDLESSCDKCSEEP
jgi:hypothetical protein